MSDYASAADRARRAMATVAKAEGQLRRDPERASLQIRLNARQRMAERLRESFEEAAAEAHVEVCDYRLVTESRGGYALYDISRSFMSYQSVFSQIYDALRNGKKTRPQVGRETWQESKLDFAYSYSGSLGVVLMAPAERSFFEGKLDSAIDAMFQVVDISGPDEVKDIAGTLGEAVIKKIHEWSRANVDGGFSVDLKWKRSDGRYLGQMVSRDHLENISDIIERTSDEKSKDISVIGFLVGYNVPSRTFQFTADDEIGSYRGSLDAAFPNNETVSVPGAYRAQIVETVVMNYATGKETRRYHLKRLSAAQLS